MRMSSRTMWGLMALAAGAGLAAVLLPSHRRGQQWQPDHHRPRHASDTMVDEASEESFPASDPPSFSGGASTPSDKSDK